MATLIVTVLGEDRTGLVDQVATVIGDQGGNWEQSRMIHLADKFAGLLLVTVTDGRAEALISALENLSNDSFRIMVDRAGASDAMPGRIATLHFVGQDHPGIVHDIAHAMAELGVGIEELESDTESASMSGGLLFRAQARLQIPEAVSIDVLRDKLEALANELMVDIELDEQS